MSVADPLGYQDPNGTRVHERPSAEVQIAVSSEEQNPSLTHMPSPRATMNPALPAAAASSRSSIGMSPASSERDRVQAVAGGGREDFEGLMVSVAGCLDEISPHALSIVGTPRVGPCRLV